MGNLSQKNIAEDVVSINLPKISKSDNPKVLSLFNDNLQYPESGMIAISQEYVENFAETNQSLFSFYYSPIKIVACTFIPSTLAPPPSHLKSDPLLLLALENKTIIFLDGKTLQIIKTFKPILRKEDISSQKFDFLSSNPSPFEDLFIDSLLAIDENQFLCGFQNGFVQRISVSNTIVLKTYNPLFFEVKTEDWKSEKKLTFILENHFLPGIASLSLCRLNDLLIVTHKNSDQSSSKRSFTLPETPILIYPINSQWNSQLSTQRNVTLNAQQSVLSNNSSNVPRFLKLVGCKGAVVQQRLMEERSFFLGLTNEGIVNVWSYKKNSPSSEETSNLAQQKDDPIERAILMKIHLEVVGMGVDAEFFCGMDVCCFEISKRGSTVDKVYEYPEKTGENVKHTVIDGDLIYFAERNGSLLISKLTFENEKNEIAWVPLKILDMKDKDKENKSRVLKSIKNLGNNINVLKYNQTLDNLYMVDQKANVRVFKKINRKLFRPLE